MSVVNNQDFWVAGSYLYLKRDDVDGVKQPLFDLGTMETANPSSDVEKLELEDSRGGQKRVIDQTVTKMNESYDVTVSNINLDNLALMYLSKPPEAFTQTAAQKVVTQWGHSGRLLHVLSTDTTPVPMYGLRIEGVLKDGATAPTDFTITAIVKATKTITVATVTLADGETFVITGLGLSDIDNAGTYTANGAVVAGTEVTVNEEFSSDETAITGSLLTEDTDEDWLEEGTDWERVDEYKGIIRIIPGGRHTADADLDVYYTTRALSGNRLIRPQSLKGEFKGTMQLYFSRGDDNEITVRECKVTISPNSSSLSGDEYSTITFTITVLSDLSETNIAGRMIAIKGTLPTAS